MTAPFLLFARPLLAGAAMAALAVAAQAGCLDEEKLESLPAMSPASAPQATPAAAAPPRALLQQLVADALARSNGIGAARLLAEEAEQDIGEAQASKKMQAFLTGSVSLSLEASKGNSGASLQARA